MSKTFEIRYKTQSEKCIEIVADTIEEAHRIWGLGVHDDEETIDEYIIGKTIEIDGVEYDKDEFSKVEQ